eukprot:jgi/Botrbrau1/13131/Bobra.0187s0086.1
MLKVINTVRRFRSYNLIGLVQSRCFATDLEVVKKEVRAEKDEQLPVGDIQTREITVEGGQAFYGDLRSTSGLGLGDGLTSHTAKWLQVGKFYDGNDKSPMEFISEAPPIKVSGAVVASYGADDPALGCPVEYIDLRGTSIDNPAVCKYTGNRFYSDDWAHHH